MRRCYNTSGKSNYLLVARGKDQIIPELNGNYRQLPFVQGDHPKLLFGDEKLKKKHFRKEISRLLKGGVIKPVAKDSKSVYPPFSRGKKPTKLID